MLTPCPASAFRCAVSVLSLAARYCPNPLLRVALAGLAVAGLLLGGVAEALAQRPVQACSDGQATLSPAQLPKEKQFEVKPLARFFVGGQFSGLLLRHPPKEQVGDKTVATTAVRVFANSRPQPTQAPRPAPDKSEPGFIEGFGPTNSTLVTAEAPEQKAFPLWQGREFLVVACNGSELLAWGTAKVVVSNRPAAIAIGIAAMLLLYVLFALAVWWVRNRDHPLQTKYPSFKEIHRYGLYEYLWNPVHLTANAFNNASVQKFQILLFSFLVAGMLLTMILETGNLSDLSATVVVLLGISGLGTALGQAANQQRDRLDFANWAWLVRKQVLPIHQSAVEGPRWGDLVLSNREFDMYKFQNLLFSLIVAAALLVAGEMRLASFAIPETLLGILGLSQGVYLAGILVRPPSIADLDAAVTKLRELEKTLKMAIAGNTDVDDKGVLKPPPAAGTAVVNPPAPNAHQMYNDQANLLEKMIESTLEVEIDRAKLNFG
jgi:hypothetical protein